MDEIVHCSYKKKSNLYSQWVPRLGDGAEYLAAVAADLAAAWPTGIPPTVVTEALTRVRDRLLNSGQECSIGQLESTLQRSGVLELRAGSHQFPAAIEPLGRLLDEHWTMSIPSLTSYIQQNRDRFTAPPDLAVDISDLIDEAAKQKYSAPQPWEWQDHAPADAARKLPAVSQSKIVAWSKKRSGMN